jgi:hypothetical protein
MDDISFTRERARRTAIELTNALTVGDSTCDTAEVLGLLAKRLQKNGHGDIAFAVQANEVDTLAEDSQAYLDAVIYGTGYTVAGKRVDPSTVKVYRAEDT